MAVPVLGACTLGAFVWALGPASVAADVVAADARWFLAGLVAVLLAVVWFRRATVERTVAGVAFLLRSTLGRVSERVRRATDRTAIQAGVDRYYETFAKVRRDRRRVALATTFPLPGGLGGVEVVLVTVLAATTGLGLVELGAVVVLYRFASYWFLVLVGGLGSAYRALTVGSGSPSTRP